MKPTLFVVIASLLLPACGSDSPATATAPTPPSIAQVAGVWAVTSTLTSVTGGECVGTILQSTIGSGDTGTMSISQTGASLSATGRSSSTGLSCTYDGMSGAATMALSWSFCDAAVLTGIRCANGALRDMRLQAKSVTATVAGNRATGTGAETWNVVVAGTQTGVGPLVSTSTFVATRQ